MYKNKMLKNLINNPNLLIVYPQELVCDKEFILEAVKQDSNIFIIIPKILQDDKDIALEVVKQNGILLRFTSKRLQDDKQLLEILEKDKKLYNFTITKWYNDIIKQWYTERMEVLNNIRNQEEKELLQSLIKNSNKTAKKIKF